MLSPMKSLIRFADHIVSKTYLRFFQEKNSLIIFYFHGILRNKLDINLNVLNPQSHGGVTIERLRQLIEYFLRHNYIFVSPNDILSCLSQNKRYTMITFDDGYFNNQYVLPILREYKIPAVFFLSVNHIKYNKCFWWDVLYRERVKLGSPIRKVALEIESLKLKTSDEIESYVFNLFGKKSFKPISDIDRPFTVSELKDFSRDKYVFLGNHTVDHAILTNYPPESVKWQILGAQAAISEITGITPMIISYPSGKYSDDVITISKKLGLKLGATIEPKKNYFSKITKSDDLMLLGRFYLGGDNGNFKGQFEVARSDVSFHNIVKNWKRKGF